MEMHHRGDGPPIGSHDTEPPSGASDPGEEEDELAVEMLELDDETAAFQIVPKKRSPLNFRQRRRGFCGGKNWFRLGAETANTSEKEWWQQGH